MTERGQAERGRRAAGSEASGPVAGGVGERRVAVTSCGDRVEHRVLLEDLAVVTAQDRWPVAACGTQVDPAPLGVVATRSCRTCAEMDGPVRRRPVPWRRRG